MLVPPQIQHLSCIYVLKFLHFTLTSLLIDNVLRIELTQAILM